MLRHKPIKKILIQIYQLRNSNASSWYVRVTWNEEVCDGASPRATPLGRHQVNISHTPKGQVNEMLIFHM